MSRATARKVPSAAMRRPEELMSDPISTPSYRPIGEEPSGAATLLRRLLPLALVVFLALSFLMPDSLRRIVPGAVVDSDAARLLAFFALVLVVAIPGIQDVRRRQAARRDAFAAFASSVGGRVTQGPMRTDGLGAAAAWEAGERVEYATQGRPVALTASRGKEAAFSFRLATEIALRRDFQMQILPGGKAMRFVMSRSFLLPVFSLAAKSAGSARVTVRRTGSPEPGPTVEMNPAQLFERMRYLADDPVTTGDSEFDRAYLVKGSDRDAARQVASDPGLHAALAALAARTRSFQVGVESESPGSPARVVVQATADPAPELFAAMDGVLRASAAALGRAGLVDAGARGVA